LEVEVGNYSFMVAIKRDTDGHSRNYLHRDSDREREKDCKGRRREQEQCACLSTATLTVNGANAGSFDI